MMGYYRRGSSSQQQHFEMFTHSHHIATCHIATYHMPHHIATRHIATRHIAMALAHHNMINAYQGNFEQLTQWT